MKIQGNIHSMKLGYNWNSDYNHLLNNGINGLPKNILKDNKMTQYSELIFKNLKGNSPILKYDRLIAMKSMLQRIAYPARGTTDETADIIYFATEIQKTFTLEELSEDEGE